MLPHEGQSGRLLRRPQQDDPAASVVYFCTAVLKNRILLENYFLPGDLEAQVAAFVDEYNNRRLHESLANVTPADAYFGRQLEILKRRENIKRMTIQARRLQHQHNAA